MGDTVESVLEHYAHVTPGLTKDALQSFTAMMAPEEDKENKTDADTAKKAV